jgi:hypothetical protein
VAFDNAELARQLEDIREQQRAMTFPLQVATAGTRVAGITGSDRPSPGIPVRDMCSMNWRPAVVCASIGNKTCRFAGLSYRNYGSDGTRTRDLRRDRPAF